MSTNGQRTPFETDMDETAADSRRPHGIPSGKNPGGRPTTARLRAIRELVQADGYQVPALLVAERMIERAVTRYQFPED
ncbi:MAG: hypothetical protein A2W26_03520 [Acidobacteria bacterium RBG_16_64_8]|nr:MAG: hypothetical protein A2W26_03520 [Acidobacteria bacterium RBG_16_64_8]